ncbi:DUF805 domain-containing protein [Roseibacterium sp. SDUM158017]|uniref:DUF805 domain-containing protein n=1 Tax=Roseicyclus salinarum TaxID=3036773 RepID=UPI002415711F|nr:DUF805 domain-containing protein [Roseibacterium sp. SDUM158017]MDG4649847.1 DUF805 domain-containing protein [Roseibacterium sp. SDUM158017]
MGMFGAVGSVYRNMFDFSGRARRAEYWWFVLFTFVVALLLQGAAIFWVLTQPQVATGDGPALQAMIKDYEALFRRYSAVYLVATLFLYWIPYLAVTVRRLHDTGRRGWWMFKPLILGFLAVLGLVTLASRSASQDTAETMALAATAVPALCSIWFIVVLCLPGTRGENRFGPDPVEGRQRQAHKKARIKAEEDDLGRQVAQQRKSEFEDYYRARVLPAIERNKSVRRT